MYMEQQVQDVTAEAGVDGLIKRVGSALGGIIEAKETCDGVDPVIVVHAAWSKLA